MQTVNALKHAKITVNGKVVEIVKMQNPCQMWRQLDALFTKHGPTARIQVVRTDGGLYKDFTLVTLKNGKTQKVNAVKETNRWMSAKLAGKPVTKKERAEAKAKAEKAAAKKAKKAAYDKARRERLKAQKAAQLNEAAN